MTFFQSVKDFFNHMFGLDISYGNIYIIGFIILSIILIVISLFSKTGKNVIIGSILLLSLTLTVDYFYYYKNGKTTLIYDNIKSFYILNFKDN